MALRTPALLLLLSLAACRGAVAARGMKALGPWSDREIVLADAQAKEDEAIAWARVGALEGLAKAGLAVSHEQRPEALTIRVREVGELEGRATLLGSPKDFVVDRAPLAVAESANVVSHVAQGKVRDAASNVEGAALATELVKQSVRVRMALELFAPGREAPLGGVIWEGYRNLDRKGEAQKAGREAGEVLAEEIASQRDRWVDRRPGSERLFLTPTPLLLEPGEVVVSLDQGLLLHGGYGLKRWLQLDLAAGGLVVPTSGGFIHSRRDGATVVGTFSIGAKVRVADEGPTLPGVAASFERVGLWSGALKSGRVALLGRVVDADSPDSTVGLNVLTLALSKHWRDWLQVGAGARLVDNHLGGTAFTEPDGGGASERLPTRLLPYANVEARAGDHFRFIGEYLYAPGPDSVVLGLRGVVFSGRRFGVIRAPGWRAAFDAAAVLTARAPEYGGGLTVLPWLGVSVYPR